MKFFSFAFYSMLLMPCSMTGKPEDPYVNPLANDGVATPNLIDATMFETTTAPFITPMAAAVPSAK